MQLNKGAAMLAMRLGVFVAALTLWGSAQAALEDRGSGLIYDTDLDITWLANASLAVDMSFGAVGVINPTGTMDWKTADSWISGMNAQGYLGYSNWRLPATLYPDGSCSAVSGGYNCTGSEMGHLFYEEIGGVAGQDIATTHNSQLALFQNIQPNMYWSSTGFAQSPGGPDDNAWTFFFPGGVQQTLAIENFAAVWAVRTGDVGVTPVPEPGSLTLLLAGLSLLGTYCARRSRAIAR